MPRAGGRGVAQASALAMPKIERGSTDTLGYANNKREAEASLLLLVDLSLNRSFSRQMIYG